MGGVHQDRPHQFGRHVAGCGIARSKLDLDAVNRLRRAWPGLQHQPRRARRAIEQHAGQRQILRHAVAVINQNRINGLNRGSHQLNHITAGPVIKQKTKTLAHQRNTGDGFEMGAGDADQIGEQSVLIA